MALTSSRVRARAVLAAVALCCGAACAGPKAVADWRMADRTVDLETDQRGPGDADLPGPDGIVDDYDNAQGRLVPAANGNISTKFPEDGRYEVVLDGCASEGATAYEWSVDGAIQGSECEARVRLAEGAHELALTVRDASGGTDTARLTADVRDLIVVGLGDSFSAGSGDSRSGLVAADYDQARCTRSGRSGQARAALEMEARDTRTSVTFIHLACGGARADYGLLGPHNNQPPQLLELSEILPPGQAVDFVSFTIGGNDARFSEIIGQLIGEPDAPLSDLAGERTHERTQRLLLELRERLARVAACFGDGFEGRPCEVSGPSGRDDDLQVVRLPRIPLVARNRVVHVTYPDLTTRKAGDGTVALCQSGAVERPDDLLDGIPDGLVNGRPAGDRSPILSGAEWAWGDATLLRPSDPAANDAQPATYPYVPESGGSPVPLPLLNTLNSVVMESAPRFGWTSSARWWRDSRGHGYCAPDADNFFFRSIFHPRDSGYEAKAAGLLAEAVLLGVVRP
jgi:lysophospholipase L1-like esterase